MRNIRDAVLHSELRNIRLCSYRFTIIVAAEFKNYSTVITYIYNEINSLHIYYGQEEIEEMKYLLIFLAVVTLAAGGTQIWAPPAAK